MSTLSSDSDSDDDDDFFKPPVFAQPKQKKKPELLTPIKVLEQIAIGITKTKPITPIKNEEEKKSGSKRPGSYSSSAAAAAAAAKKSKKRARRVKTKTDDAYEKLKAERQKDPKWIEKQARKTVEEVLRLDVVENVTDLNDIGWYQYLKKGKTLEFYPAILSKNNAEARILLKNKTTNKNTKVQYIGVAWKDALKYEQIALSKWIPYTKGNDSENEKRLQNFVKHISKTSLFANNLVGLKIEELAVRKMWEKVRIQAEHRQREDEKETAEAQAAAAEAADTLPPVSVTQDSDNNSHCGKNEAAVYSDDDDDDDDDDEHLLSPGKKRAKRTSLRLNDEIEFYELMGTFGDPSQLRSATVVGVRPDDSLYPLLISNTTIPLPGTHLVRRLPDGYWQPINDFLFLKEGVQSMTAIGSGFYDNVKKMRKVKAAIAQATDDFWKNDEDGNEGENNDSKNNDSKNEKKEKSSSRDDGNDKDNSDTVHPVPAARKNRRSSLRIRSKGIGEA